ncbi:MAG TPA: hypothetical protein PLM38_06125, partial [Ottowia sp.]|nr:hypothetical protein [Ottowia sp.]
MSKGFDRLSPNGVTQAINSIAAGACRDCVRGLKHFKPGAAASHQQVLAGVVAAQDHVVDLAHVHQLAAAGV